MKLEIYEPVKLEEKETPVRLALKQVCNGIIVVAVDEGGAIKDCGVLLCFNKNGKICLCSCVNPNLGFQHDKSGKIKVGE